MTVTFGTAAVETALTSLAPSRAMPPASYFEPTMKPVMFCRKSSGIRRWQQSSMKCAPFCELSEKSTPLLATMPTGMPSIWAKPQTSVVPKRSLNSSKSEPSTMRPITSRMS